MALRPYAIQNCEIEQERIDFSVRKILAAKYWCGLNEYKSVKTDELYCQMQTEDAQWLNYKLYDNTITLLKNAGGLIPIRPFMVKRIASVVINDIENNLFQQTLKNYDQVDCYSLSKDASEDEINSLYKKLKKYDEVIVSVHNTTTNATKKFGITESMQIMVDKLSSIEKSIICFFGNPYTLEIFKKMQNYKAIILAYEDTYLPQYFAAQAMFGAGVF